MADTVSQTVLFPDLFDDCALVGDVRSATCETPMAAPSLREGGKSDSYEACRLTGSRPSRLVDDTAARGEGPAIRWRIVRWDTSEIYQALLCGPSRWQRSGTASLTTPFTSYCSGGTRSEAEEDDA